MSAIKFALGLASLTMGAIKIGEALSSAGDLGRVSPGRGRTPVGGRHQRRVVGGQPVQMSIYPVKSLDDRINRIRDRVAKGMVDPQVYGFARKVVNQKCGGTWCIPEKDNLKEMQAIFQAVRKNVRYTSDIHNIDTYQHPKHTLGLNGGDCDDYSSLLCSLLLSLGIPCRLKVIQTKDSRDWNHIYAQGGLPRAAPTRWYSLDASVPKPFGWEAPRNMVTKSRIFPVR
jgi:hypothetical protein